MIIWRTTWGSFNSSPRAEFLWGWVDRSGGAWHIAMDYVWRWTDPLRNCWLGLDDFLGHLTKAVHTILSYEGHHVLKRRLGKAAEHVHLCFSFLIFLFIPSSRQFIIFVYFLFSCSHSLLSFIFVLFLLSFLLLLKHSLIFIYIYWVNFYKLWP